MSIKQISQIETRTGLQQNLPQLEKGEFGWAIDTQRLFIGNGTVADGAPLAGNTEILTVLPVHSLTLIDTATSALYSLTVTSGVLHITAL